jgi:bleomycin hydrolase
MSLTTNNMRRSIRLAASKRPNRTDESPVVRKAIKDRAYLNRESPVRSEADESPVGSEADESPVGSEADESLCGSEADSPLLSEAASPNESDSMNPMNPMEEAIAGTITASLRATKDNMIEMALRKYRMRIAPNGYDLSGDDLLKYKDQYLTTRNSATANALANIPASYLAENRSVTQDLNYAYSHPLAVCPQATNQQWTGRCWIFAALNAIRYHLIRQLNLNSTFELSEAYLFFYDKLERTNFYLEKMIELRTKPYDDNVVFNFLTTGRPTQDGGQYGYFKNLIKKYGMVPKSCYGESFNSQVSDEMNEMLWRKIAQFTDQIRSSDLPDEELRTLVKDTMMPIIYAFMVDFMGEPPSRFTWAYHEAGANFESEHDRGQYHSVEDLSPLEFYSEYVLPEFNIDNMVMLRHDPRSEYYKTYSGEHAGNMIGGQLMNAFNVPVQIMKNCVALSLMSENPVWFACDVGKDHMHERGLLSTEAFDYESLMGTDFEITKGQQLNTFLSGPNHAMMFAGVDLDDTQEIPEGDSSDPVNVIYRKWRVENSWGEYFPYPDAGYLQMGDEWFDKYVYEAVVPIDLLPDDLQEIYKTEQYTPVVLPYNDPFGAVAKRNTPKVKHVSKQVSK